MKASFEASQRSVKIKIDLFETEIEIFISIQLSEMYGTLRDKFSPIRVAAFESLIVEYSIHITSIQLIYPLRGIDLCIWLYS